MKHFKKVAGVLMGLVVAGYGASVIITQELSTEGSMRRVGLSLHRAPAILNGVLIFILGSYMVYLAFKLEK